MVWFYYVMSAMRQENSHNQPYRIYKGMNDLEIERAAHHFHISKEDVKDRITIVEKQRKMTQALLLNRAAAKN
mgnify:CR=1 FL=1